MKHRYLVNFNLIHFLHPSNFIHFSLSIFLNLYLLPFSFFFLLYLIIHLLHLILQKINLIQNMRDHLFYKDLFYWKFLQEIFSYLYQHHYQIYSIVFTQLMSQKHFNLYYLTYLIILHILQPFFPLDQLNFLYFLFFDDLLLYVRFKFNQQNVIIILI